MLLSLSILSADFLHLGDEIARMTPYVDRLHFDVMDGHFVHEVSFGLPILKQLHTTLPIDTHLMVTNPEASIHDYAPLSDVIYLHEESIRGKDAAFLVTVIKSYGCHAGLTLNPETPIAEVTSLLPLFSHVLIMSVHPGAGGQECILETLDKIPQIKQLHPEITVCVDGGMNEKTAPIAKEKGADVVVSGSYVLKAGDSALAASKLR